MLSSSAYDHLDQRDNQAVIFLQTNVQKNNKYLYHLFISINGIIWLNGIPGNSFSNTIQVLSAKML